MKALDFRNWSERQQVASVIFIGALLIALLTYFLLLPQISSRERLADMIKQKQGELQQQNYLYGERVLERKLAKERTYTSGLAREWNATVERLSTFRESDLFHEQVTLSQYKTARIAVCDELKALARKKGIATPEGFGLKETVNSDENVQIRTKQLLAVEKLVRTLLDVDTESINRLTVLRPVRHTAPDAKQPFIEEFPVSVEFVATLDGLYDLFSEALTDQQVFSLRNIRIEMASAERPDKLRINAVMSALVFLHDVSDLLPKAAKQVSRRPRGY